MQIGWVYEPVISHYESLLFINALSKHKDQYRYYPISVAKREEIGLKYRYLCIAKSAIIDESRSHFANIEVYKPPQGMPYVTRLRRLSFDQII